MSNVVSLKKKFKALNKLMDEKMRRLWVACEAESIGWGGVSIVSAATGLSRTTITAGVKELADIRRKRKVVNKIRHGGGGRKEITQIFPTIVCDLEKLVDPVTRGDPESPLRWTCKSTYKLSDELKQKGYEVGPRKVAYLLKELNYSLQSTRKTKEGASHPDRDKQFQHINQKTAQFQRKGQPVISVDAKKKELIGDFSNKGREYQPKGQPEKTRVHDFVEKESGKGIPYGVFDLFANQGWVSVGNDHDTSEFAGETIERWWNKMGCKQYPNAKDLLITADGGGSNGSRTRLWKVVLQKFADKTGLKISICHFPPGTSKWNKIEYQMFSYITQNWRGRPLVSHQVMVNLIGNTTTRKGLKIKAQIDTNKYPTGIKISDEEIAKLNIKKNTFHGEWNYQIAPRMH